MEFNTQSQNEKLGSHLLQNFIEQTPVSIQIHSSDGKLINSNPAFAKLYALSKEALAGLYEKYNVLEDEQAVKLGVMPYIKRTFAGETVAFPEYEYNGIDTLKTLDIDKPVSRKNWVKTQGFPIKDEDGNVTNAVFFSEDITAQKKAEIASIESEQKFKDLFEQSPLVYEIYDRDGVMVDANVAFENLWQLKKEDLIGKYKVLESEQVKTLGFLPYFEKAYAGERADIEDLEFDATQEEVTKGGGRKRWISNILYPIKDVKGEVTHVVMIHEDITDRKKAEKELQESRLFIDNLIQSANMMIVGIDKEGKVNIFNPAAERISGYSYDEIKDKDWFSTLVPIEKYPEVHKEFNRLMEGGTPKLFENPILTKNGEERIISWTNDEIFKDKEAAGLISFGIDITDQKKAEEERKRIFDLSSDLIGIAGFDGLFKQLNPAWLTTLGYSFAELMSKPFVDFVHPDDVQKTITEVNKLALGQKTIDFENRYFHKDGSVRHISWTATPLVSEKNIYCIGRDITESKKHEKDLKESEEKFRLLVEQSPYSIQIFNTDGHLDQVNESFKKLWGIDEESLQEVLDNYNVLEDKEAEKLGVVSAIQSVFSGGEPIILPLIEYDAESTLDAAGIKVKANKRWIQARLYPVKNSKGEVVNVVDMEEDMSITIQKEQEILNNQQRLKDLALELTYTEEKQRKQIATDLHDDVGQLLASARLQIAAMNKDMDKEDIFGKMKDVSHGLLEAIQSTRSAIFALSPPQLNEIGLVAALSDWMEEEVEAKHGIKTSLLGRDQIYAISEQVRYLLFRCVREMLINVIKHAKATQLSLNIFEENEVLYIAVQDDGTGFDYRPDIQGIKQRWLWTL